MFFRLVEYASAEAAFVRESIYALARAKDPVFAGVEFVPSPTIGITQVTVDSGEVVEQTPVSVVNHLSVPIASVIASKVDDLLPQLDA
jgi:hypothetical protein